MKILHTSDWHLGKRLHNQPLEEEHKLFFEWLFGIIENKKIDVLVVAGDIFDVAYPSGAALKLYYKTLSKLSLLGLKHIIITAGNHDSASTINAPKDLLKHMSITVTGSITGSIDEILVFLPSRENPEAVICAVPFLRERDIRTATNEVSIENKVQQYREGVAGFFEKLAETVRPYKEKGAKIITTGHLFVKNGDFDTKEQEKYSLGGVYDITTNDFPDIFDYAALGHIHRAYAIDKTKRIRYSGNPLKMSFDENNNKKVLILDTDTMQVEDVDVPQWRDKVRFEGDFLRIKTQLENYKNDKPLEPAWAEVIIKSEQYDPAIEESIKELNKSLEHIEIIDYKILKNNNAKTGQAIEDNATLDDFTPTDIFRHFLEEENIANKEQLMEAFKELLHGIRG